MDKKINLLLKPEFYIPFFLFSGRSSLARLGIDLGFQMPTLTISILLFILLLFIMGCKKTSFKSNILHLLFWVFGIMMLISCLYTPNQILGLKKVFEYFVFIMPLYFLVIINIKKEINFINLLYGNYIVCLILLFLGVFNLVKTGATSRLAVLGGGPNVYGRFMFYGFMCSITFILKEYCCNNLKANKIYLFFNLNFSILFLIFIILSGSRGVLLSTILSFISLLFIIGKYNKKMIIRILISIFGLGIFFYFQFRDIINYYINSRFRYLFTSIPGGSAVSTRIKFYKDSIDIFLDNFFLGAGANSFRGLGKGIYPHNLILEIASEQGIIGLSIFFLIFLSVMILLYKVLKLININEIYLVTFVVVGLFFAFISAQFSGDLYDNRFIIFYIALLFSLYKIIIDKRKQERLINECR